MREGMLFMALSLALAGTLSAAEPYEKFLGTWKEIPSAQSPVMMKIEPDGNGGVKVSTASNQDGTSSQSVVAKYDGKQYRTVNDPDATVALQKNADGTVEQDKYFNGTLTGKSTWKISPDGNTLTVKGQSLASKDAVQMTTSYNRSGGPSSANDPLIGFWIRSQSKPVTLTMTFKKQGGALVLMAEGVVQSRNCNGQDHPVNPNVADYTMSCRFTDDRTQAMLFKKDGKVVATGTDQISDDGKTLIVVRNNAEGKSTLERTFKKVQAE